jgi:hypothetical protein
MLTKAAAYCAKESRRDTPLSGICDSVIRSGLPVGCCVFPQTVIIPAKRPAKGEHADRMVAQWSKPLIRRRAAPTGPNGCLPKAMQFLCEKSKKFAGSMAWYSGVSASSCDCRFQSCFACGPEYFFAKFYAKHL